MRSVYLSFSRSQRIGIISLLILNLTACLVYFLLPYFIGQDRVVNNQMIQEILSKIVKDTVPSGHSVSHLTPFPFDPNTLDEIGFKRLGLTPKLAQTIIHYRNKGGHFYHPESFRKIWGLHEEAYQALLPFIRIENNRKTSLIVEINTCDTAALIRLPGIGPTLATNIIAYRHLLGGFIYPEQLKEVWGLKEETYRKIRPLLRLRMKTVRKINVNLATLEEMKQHPYLRGEVALSIVNYRKSVNYHISQIEELKNQTVINAELFRKIAPYISTR